MRMVEDHPCCIETPLHMQTLVLRVWYTEGRKVIKVTVTLRISTTCQTLGGPIGNHELFPFHISPQTNYHLIQPSDRKLS